MFWGSELHGTQPGLTGLQKSSWHRPLWVSERPASMSRRQDHQDNKFTTKGGIIWPQYDIQIVESHLSHLYTFVTFVTGVMFLIPACACTAQGSLDMLLSKASLASGASFLRGETPTEPGMPWAVCQLQRTKDAAKHLSAESAVLKLSVNWLQQTIIRTDHSPTSIVRINIVSNNQ